ncbi:MAG: HAD family hydrolase [Candidatus Omnitrophica bacterium]|nr:HAD family hydrolase [Candidatus Omnitrophota bacterium]
MAELPSSLRDVELIVLDMDGVITSEKAYWDAAGLVIRDILDSPVFLGLCPPDYTPIADLFYQRLARGDRSDWRKYLPIDLIQRCKSRGINSNWDLAYLVAGLYIAPFFSPFSSIQDAILGKPASHLHPNPSDDESKGAGNFSSQLKDNLQPIWNRLEKNVKEGQWSQFLRLHDFHLWGALMRERKRSIAPIKKIELSIMDDFHPDVRGIHLLDEINKLIDPNPSRRPTLFGRKTALWEECRDLFQQFFLGEDLYKQHYGRSFIYTPKPGLIHKEEPLHGKNKTNQSLERLQKAGYRLGIATGRPRMEIVTPLSKWDALRYFEADRIVTYDDVEKAEKILMQSGFHVTLGKPHPYAFMKSIRSDLSENDVYRLCDSSLPDRHKILIVGDAMADIWAAKKIDCPCAALLSGAMGESGRRDLESAHPDIICHDFLELTDALVKAKNRPA